MNSIHVLEKVVKALSVLIELLLLFCDVGYLNVCRTKATDFHFQVEQKLAGLEGHLSSDKQKQGTAGNDRDSIRASILDEAVIVCKPLLMLRRSIILPF